MAVRRCSYRRRVDFQDAADDDAIGKLYVPRRRKFVSLIAA